MEINLIKITDLHENQTGTMDIDLILNGEKYYGILLKRESNLGEQHEIA